MVRAPINGPTLHWARTVMNIEQEELAKAAGTTLSRISAFEADEMNPTLRQLEKMATKLDRTLAFFFTPPPGVPDVPETADFRGRRAEPLPSMLLREMRRAEQQRDALLDLGDIQNKADGIEKITWSNVHGEARKFRSELGLGEDFVPKGSQPNQAFNFWRDLLEGNGYLVFQVTKIPIDVFRGLSIFHDRMPIILLNGMDAANGKIFTLFHEVAHLANRTSGLCALEEDVNEEALANSFAANFLMPEKQIRKLLDGFDEGPSVLAEKIRSKFKVSYLAAGVRLRTLDIIDDRELAEIWRQSDEDWMKRRESQKRQGGGPPPWRIRYRDLGPTYIGTVARAVENHRVDWLDASYLLNARIPMVQQMFDEYYRTEEHL